ncbi:hypothetical protein DIPPA_05837 [Diplonema papillatum]|nr:hypothetical protein DIPPA_05837 [Diplonema papillatum]|eukprot:gene3647-5675_t
MGDPATFDEKVRMAYDELDVRKNRSVTQDSFMTVLSKLHIDFSTATMQDLFTKADLNRDGVLSHQEFQRFADNYPTMLDVLYYRSKDYYLDKRQLENIETGKQELNDLENREAAARRAVFEREQEAEALEHDLNNAVSDIHDAENREKDARQNLDRAHSDTDAAKAVLRERSGDLARSRDVARQKQAMYNEARKEVEANNYRIQQADNEVNKAEERLRDMERLLADQRQVLDDCLVNAAKARDGLSAAQDKEESARSAADDSSREVEMAGDYVKSAEQDLSSRQSRESEAASMLREASGETARAVVKRDQCQKELKMAKDRDQRAKREQDLASRMVEEQQKDVDDMILENQEHAARRKTIQEEEMPLLEQEVRLKEQRDCLEAKEGELRNRFSEFSHTRGPGDGPGGRSISPPLNRSMGGSPHRVPPSSYYQTSPTYTSVTRGSPTFMGRY